MKLVRPVVGLAILLLAVTRQAAASPITYTNEATFIGAAGTLGFESFEALAATNSVSPAFTATLAAFTLAGAPQAGVFDELDYAGTHAIDGKNYVEVEGGTRQFLTFTFFAPIEAFGRWILAQQRRQPWAQPVELDLRGDDEHRTEQ